MKMRAQGCPIEVTLFYYVFLFFSSSVPVTQTHTPSLDIDTFKDTQDFLYVFSNVPVTLTHTRSLDIPIYLKVVHLYLCLSGCVSATFEKSNKNVKNYLHSPL